MATDPDGENDVAIEEPLEEPGDVARLTFFSDAAVAISLTLLFLPVADYVREMPAANWSELFVDNPEIIQSATSFAVIVVCWRYHHILFERIRDYSRQTVWLNFIWLFCVVAIPVMTLAILPTDESGYRDYRRIFDTLFIRGEREISYENYFIFWAVIALSFLMLFLISRHTGRPERMLAKPGRDTSTESWIYLRPFVVCAVTAVAGLVNPALGDTTLIVGIGVAVIFAQREKGREGKQRESGA